MFKVVNYKTGDVILENVTDGIATQCMMDSSLKNLCVVPQDNKWEYVPAYGNCWR